MPTPTQTYQGEIARHLRQIYKPPIKIETEWRAITNVSGLYCPRIDIAVGPFAAGRTYIPEYDQLMEGSRQFIENLIGYHRRNIHLFGRDGRATSTVPFHNLKTHNQNARCLLAIEIENAVSRKHMLGGAINAAALGRIGIAIGWTDEKVKAFVKLREYWNFLRRVGKNTFDTTNLLILSPGQFEKAVIDCSE